MLFWQQDGGYAATLRLFWASRIVLYGLVSLTEPSGPTWRHPIPSNQHRFHVENLKNWFWDNFRCLARSFVSLVITVYSTLHWFLMKENIFVTLGCSYNRTATTQNHQNDGPRVADQSVNMLSSLCSMTSWSAPPEVLEFSTRLLRLRAYLRRLKNIVLLKNLIHGQFRDQQIGNRQHTDCLKIRYLDLYVEMALDGEPNYPPGGLWLFKKSKPFIKNNSGCPEQS